MYSSLAAHFFQLTLLLNTSGCVHVRWTLLGTFWLFLEGKIQGRNGQGMVPVLKSNLQFQDSEGAEILLYFHGNKLACSFMDAGGRHKTPGSEVKHSSLLSVASALRFVLVP